MKSTIQNSKDKQNITIMKDLKPLQLAEVMDPDLTEYNGCIVMRTQAVDKFEVLNLSKLEKNKCWTSNSTLLQVRLLKPNEKITLVMSND